MGLFSIRTDLKEVVSDSRNLVRDKRESVVFNSNFDFHENRPDDEGSNIL